jgi:hypothetical protein
VASQYFRILATAPLEPRRSALLERLLARADASRPVSDWRADAFRSIAPPDASAPAVAPAALFAEGADVDGAWVCLATPVHYVAEMTSVRLSRDGMLSLNAAAAAALAADFNRVWSDSGIRLAAGGAGHLFCTFDQTLHVTTRDPQEVLDRHIEEYLPVGADAPRLRRLMSEMEMWLYEQNENSIRAAAGRPRISGLWLWGGGAPLSSRPDVQGWAVGDDVYFNALGARRGETSDSGVIVAAATPGSDEWHEIESRWLKPAAALLRAGRLSRLDLSAGDRCWSVGARAMRRFWRRSKPWWESLA